MIWVKSVYCSKCFSYSKTKALKKYKARNDMNMIFRTRSVRIVGFINHRLPTSLRAWVQNCSWRVSVLCKVVGRPSLLWRSR